MRLFGRITIYGEYLMHADAFGLVTRSTLFLSDEHCQGILSHNRYRPQDDGVRQYLLARDLPTNSRIHGNLPFGRGFASSTALGFLHLSTLPLVEARLLVDSIDRHLHGFDPSGVDSGFYCRGRGGLYKRGKWHDVNGVPLNWGCALLPKERAFDLPEARRRVLRRSANLSRLARQMTNSLQRGHDLPLDHLFKYACELQEAKVYSQSASLLVESALQQGIIAKGIGGLYDKAIIILSTGANQRSFESLRGQVCRVQENQWLEDI